MQRHVRFRLRDASTVANPDGTTDVLVASTKPSDAWPVLAAWPEIGGASVDPLTGESRDGEWSLRLIDVASGGTSRLLTSLLQDGAGRWEPLSRRAYLDVEDDGGGWTTCAAGYVLQLQLEDSLTWLIRCGESRRIEQTQKLFTSQSAQFPLRGALVGGPIVNTAGGAERFFTIEDRGGWEFEVAGYDAGTGDITLIYRAGYFAQGPWRMSNTAQAITEAEFAVINQRCYPYFDQRAHQYGGGQFTGLSAYVVGTGIKPPISFNPFSGLLFTTFPTGTRTKLRWGASPPANGTRLRVHYVPNAVSDEAPAFFTLHPCDLLARAWTAHGLPYDSSALEAVRGEIGPTVRISARVGSPPVLADFLRDCVQGPFGVGLRRDTQGRLVPFMLRRRNTAVPAVQINLADCWDRALPVFDLEERSAIAQVRLEMQQYSLAVPNPQADSPPDGVSGTPVLYSPPVNPDATTFTTAEHTYRVPAMIHTVDARLGDGGPLTQSIALEVYDRYGRGAPRGAARVVYGSVPAAAQIGDRLLLALPHAVNANKRLGDDGSVGARVLQVLQRVPRQGYVELQLEDVGTTDQAVSPAPTISIAASGSSPRTVALFTITNAAAINAAAVLGVAVEWATGASAPTVAGADFARYLPGAVPTAATPLPGVPAGTRVWVRARSEQSGRRPSSWSAWADVTLAGLAAPTGLSADVVDGRDTVTLSWTPATASNRTEVALYQGASVPGDWTPHVIATLPAGADASFAVPVSPGGLPYQWRVRQLEPDGTPGAAATSAFTGPVSSVVEPTLQCTLTLTATTAEIAFVAVGTVEYSVDGGAWSAGGTSPIVIARNAAGGALKAVTVRATLDGRLVTDTLPVPPQGWVGDGAIDVAKFAAGIRPIELLGSLPPDGVTVGRIVLLTTDFKLYRWTGTAWTAYVSAGDISGTIVDAQIASLAAAKVTGQLTSAQIGDLAAAKITGQLSDTQLAAIAAAKITGQLSDTQLAAIAAAKVTGQLSDTQLAAIAAAKVTGQIVGTQITDGAISTAKLAAGAVTAATIAAETITATQIAAGAITSAELAAGAVSAGKIAAGAIVADDIAANTITGAKIAAGTITGANIAADTITAAQIAADAITATELAAGAVTTAKLVAGAVTAAELAADSVTAAKIAAGAIVAGKIAAGAVTAAEIAAGAVVAGKIAANAVGTAELAADSVIAGKIAAGAIGVTQLAADAVTAAKIAAGTITGDRLAAGTITGDRIAASQSLSAPIIEGGRIRGAFVDVNHLLIRDTLEIRPTDSLGNPVTRTRKVAVSLASFVSVDLPGSGYVTAARRLEWSIEFSANALSVAALSMGAPAVLVAPVVVPAGATLTSAGAYYFAQSDRQVRLLVTTQAEGASTWATIGDSGWVTSFGWLSTALSHLVTAGQSLVFLLLIQNTSSSLYGGIIAPTVDYTVPTYTIGV